MDCRIENLMPKTLVGHRLTMSFSKNRTFELWHRFMPARKNIPNQVGSDLFSVQQYGQEFNFKYFDPTCDFEKWACVEVSLPQDIPSDMEVLQLEGGLYAVFNYKGPVSKAAEVFNYIFNTWLPPSGYQLAQRPHFEILGEKYSNHSPDSEEEIWIPIQKQL